MPGISTVQLSTMLAKRTLSSYLDKIDSGADISDRECIRANASVGFLNDDEYGRDRLKKYFPQFDEKIKVTGMNSEINHKDYPNVQNSGFCGGCRSNCSLTNPNCPTGMERAGWSAEAIEKAMIERAVPINKGSHIS